MHINLLIACRAVLQLLILTVAFANFAVSRSKFCDCDYSTLLFTTVYML